MEQVDPARPTGLKEEMAAIGPLVDAAMHADLGAALAGCDPLLVEVLRYSLFGGGKRIRPLLTVLSARACGRDDTDLYLLATAFEYLHVATLVHDDVIDAADLRRGRPTVTARFGLPAAILAGDWLHARSMHLIGRLAGPQGLKIFCRATASMVNGEFLQLRHRGALTLREEDYFEVIRLKTGNLIASTCEIGALFAHAEPERQAALAAYGDSIGAAFQVVDDLLDYQGDPHQTGKQVGIDFLEGKITLPLLLALETAEDADRELLTGLITGDRQLPEAYGRTHALIDRLGGFRSAALVAQSLVENAIGRLGALPPWKDPASIAVLGELARYLLARKK